MLPVLLVINCATLPPKYTFASVELFAPFVNLEAVIFSIAARFAKIPSLDKPDAVVTANPPVLLSLKEIFPKKIVCVPKYNDKNFLVGEPKLNTPETLGNMLPVTVMFLFTSIDLVESL